MNATKATYQQVNSEIILWDANGSIPALLWVDANSNNWRVRASYQFDSNTEVYAIVVTKELKLNGTTDWVHYSQYEIIADYSKYRILSTGIIVEDITGIPAALDADGNVVDPDGWVYNSKFFTMLVGYNDSATVVSINHWVYIEMASAEGLTIV